MSPADITALLRRQPLFASLDEAAVEALSHALVGFCLPGGRPLFKRGKPTDALYVLQSGSLGVFSGSTTLVQQINAGAVVGEVSLLGGGMRHQTVRTLRDCELLRLDQTAFKALMHRHPGILLSMTRLTVGQLQSRVEHGLRVDAPGTFAILPLDRSVPARALAMQFAMAHLGALQALHEAGHVFDAVGGAIVGAEIAAGWSAQETTERCVPAFVQGRPLSDWTLPLVAMTRGRRASKMLQSTFGALMIEDLPLPFFCISTSLSGDGQVVHREGPLWLWLRASSAIPGVLPPVFQHGHVYVDGALANNLPTDVMAADGLARITALDVHAEITLQADVDESSTPALWQLMWQKRRRPVLVSTLVRAGMVNSDEAALHRRDLADLLITPLEQIGMLDWKNWRGAVEIGYQHTLEVLEARARE